MFGLVCSVTAHDKSEEGFSGPIPKDPFCTHRGPQMCREF